MIDTFEKSSPKRYTKDWGFKHVLEFVNGALLSVFGLQVKRFNRSKKRPYSLVDRDGDKFGAANQPSYVPPASVSHETLLL